jgi:hypothetical protein
MASKTDIANQALTRVGAKTIMDLDDETSSNARTVKNVFELSVRQLARSHPWNCLKARANLAQLSTGPAFEYEYRYRLPTNCVRLVDFNGVYVWDRYEGFTIEGRDLLTNSSEAKITFIRYEEDPTVYDPMLIEALVILIASKVAIPIRQDESLSRSYKEEYERIALPEARRVNGVEQNKIRVRQEEGSRWLKARRYSTNG